MKLVALLVAASFTLVAHTQEPPVPQEVKDMVAQIAKDAGVTAYGEVSIGYLDDGDSAVVSVPVASDQLTIIQIMGADGTNAIKVRALTGDKEIATTTGADRAPVVQIPAGSGDSVKLKLDMACAEIECAYFIMTFVH